MKLALLLPPRSCDLWTLAKQVGVTHAVTKATSELSGLGPPDDLAALRQIKRRFDDAGITLLGLEGDAFDMTRIKWGLPGRDEDLERYHKLLANMSELGLNLLCYNFMPRPRGAAHDWHRTKLDIQLRGGSRSTGFNLADVPPVDTQLTQDQLWDNYAYFLKAVLPAAEAAGVTMALHPDDPPLPQLAGVARLFYTPANFDRAYELAPSPNNAVTFCQANFKLMGCDLEATARHFGKRIAFVHVRDVEGTAERFSEVWHDAGPTDLGAMLQVYHDIGFRGPLRDDHVPLMHDEPTPIMPGYGTLGHLFALGYLRGLMRGRGIPEE